MLVNDKTITPNINFTPLSEKDLSLLYRWFQIPHVKKWYAREVDYSYEMIRDKYLPRIVDSYQIPNFIISVNEFPIGYIQYYRVNNYLPESIEDYEHPLFKKYSADRMAGIDLFIAEKHYLQTGVSSKALNQFIAEKITGNFDLVLVDPVKSNFIANNFFFKNGFSDYADGNNEGDYLLLIRTC